MIGFLWECIRRLLFLFDAETVHLLSIRIIRMLGCFHNAPLRILSGARPLPSQNVQSTPVLGMTFASRVGLAAGFDKNAEILRELPALGFGFAEIGTVTPRPQPGNPRPRLYRDAPQRSLFNRMGFNNLGAETVAAHVATAKPYLPEGFRVGINVGKNKDTAVEDTPNDYLLATRPFKDLADYLVLNVSSPNTPGLRSFQTVENLRPLVETVVNELGRWAIKPPLLVKLAPELEPEQLKEILPPLEKMGVSGWVLTNTLAGTHQNPLTGGWSGEILKEISRNRLVDARTITRLPIISVGGIMNEQEATIRFKSGADLIQLYSGWVFGGPQFPSRISLAVNTSLTQRLLNTYPE